MKFLLIMKTTTSGNFSTKTYSDTIAMKLQPVGTRKPYYNDTYLKSAEVQKAVFLAGFIPSGQHCTTTKLLRLKWQ